MKALAMKIPTSVYHPNKTEPAVPIEKFGKDHWSALGYVECRCVDNDGIPHRPHLRIDIDRHPGLAHSGSSTKKKYPTRLKGEQLEDHDDWDCIEDLEAVGLLEIHGTGIHPVLRMTNEGKSVAAKLRAHKTDGGSFSTFSL